MRKGADLTTLGEGRFMRSHINQYQEKYLMQRKKQMNKELITTIPVQLDLDNVERTKELAKKLMLTKHYQKIGEDGIFAICMVAQANKINQLDALNGELYYVQGRVGMSAEAMNKYIRQAGHSITLKSLTDQGCTVVGKRKDNGDIAEITYGLDDMKSAGKNYEKNKKDMFFARAISRLKRILFPDLLCKIYEKSEIEEIARDENEQAQSAKNILEDLNLETKEIKPKLSTEQVVELQNILLKCDSEYQDSVKSFIKKRYKADILDDIPAEDYDRVKKGFETKMIENQKKLFDLETENLKVEAKVNE
jgi:hypothetical protein